MSLIDEVKTELVSRKGSWPQISEETGISYSYICKLMDGTIKNPSYNRLMELHRYLFESEAA